MSATPGWCLRLKAQPDFRVDFGGVLPARLAAMTADEVAELLGESVLSVRPRVSELKAQGRVEATTKRRCNVSGKTAVVWRAVDVWRQEALL